MRSALLVFAGLLCTRAGAAPPPPSESLALSGPRVTEEGGSRAAGIIEHGFDGLVKPAQPTPEEAAIGLLALNDEERAKVSAIIGKRSRIIDEFVTGNTELLTKLGVAFNTNDTTDKANLLIEAVSQLRELIYMGPLQDSLRECLSEANARAFDRTLKQYWDAYTAPRLPIPKEDGKLPSRFEVVSQAKLESLGKEIEHSFERLLMSGEYVRSLLFKGIPLEDEQKVKTHDLLEKFMIDTKGMATDQQNLGLFFNILPLLTEAQRPMFLDNIKVLIQMSRPPKKHISKGTYPAAKKQAPMTPAPPRPEPMK